MDIVKIVDFVIGVCFILSILAGYHRGLVVTIAGVVAMVASYIGALAAVRAGGSVLSQSIYFPLLDAVIFSLSFALLQFVFANVIRTLKLVDRLPIIGRLDKLGGAVLGFFWVFLLCLFLGNIFFTYVPEGLRHLWGFTDRAVENTVLLNAFVPDTAK